MRSFGKKSCWNTTGLRGKKCDLRSFFFHLNWRSCKFTSHYTFILLLYYIALIETKFRTTSDSRTRSLKAVSETTVDTSAKIAGMSL